MIVSRLEQHIEQEIKSSIVYKKSYSVSILLMIMGHLKAMLMAWQIP